MNDNRCPICNFEISAYWSQHIVYISKLAADRVKRRFIGVVIACPECLPPVVIPRWFQ